MTKYFLVIMLLGNPTQTTWVEMPTLQACEVKKDAIFKKAIAKGDSILIRCQERKIR